MNQTEKQVKGKFVLLEKRQAPVVILSPAHTAIVRNRIGHEESLKADHILTQSQNRALTQGVRRAKDLPSQSRILAAVEVAVIAGHLPQFQEGEEIEGIQMNGDERNIEKEVFQEIQIDIKHTDEITLKNGTVKKNLCTSNSVKKK